MAITQSITIKASPKDAYTALTSAQKFSAVTSAPATIADEEGGAFSCFGDQITGRHIELNPNQRIVQAWRVANWPEGVYSIVRMDISGSVDGTTIDLTHTGYPADAAEHLEPGWHKMYWGPLKAHLEC
jgi:activator of HSP90 ATPase